MADIFGDVCEMHNSKAETNIGKTRPREGIEVEIYTESFLLVTVNEV
jgi:hypothetical protein